MKKFGKPMAALLPVMIIALALATAAVAGKSFEPITTGSMESGDAVLELSPSMKGAGRLVVGFAANTHSVDLSRYDLKEITTLEFDGKEIRPSKADRLRGHHAYGKIVFDVGREIDSFRIKVVGIPAMEERIYEWK